MKKPTIYFDTNIFSAYWYSGTDVSALARRLATREWWASERPHFSIWVSAATENELSAGKFRGQSPSLQMARRLTFLPVTRQVRRHAARLAEAGVVPREKPGDALQMAVCAQHSIDYLLSWNYAHLVNPIAQRQLAAACAVLGLRAPLLVSPESIPKVRLGQTIRRED